MFAYNLKKNILLKLQKHGKNAKDLTDTIEFILKEISDEPTNKPN